MSIGQLDSATSPASIQIEHPICGEGYITPPLCAGEQYQYTFGATFDLDSTDTSVREEDNQANLKKLEALLPNTQIGFTQISGRTSFRCSTPDYMPIVGPMITPSNETRLADFKKNKYAEIPKASEVFPGLFINVGHGSRGLAYTPICAEIIASLITGCPIPVSHTLYQQMHPGRFLVRNLMRNN